MGTPIILFPFETKCKRNINPICIFHEISICIHSRRPYTQLEAIGWTKLQIENVFFLFFPVQLFGLCRTLSKRCQSFTDVAFVVLVLVFNVDAIVNVNRCSFGCIAAVHTLGSPFRIISMYWLAAGSGNEKSQRAHQRRRRRHGIDKINYAHRVEWMNEWMDRSNACRR